MIITADKVFLLSRNPRSDCVAWFFRNLFSSRLISFREFSIEEDFPLLAVVDGDGQVYYERGLVESSVHSSAEITDLLTSSKPRSRSRASTAAVTKGSSPKMVQRLERPENAMRVHKHPPSTQENARGLESPSLEGRESSGEESLEGHGKEDILSLASPQEDKPPSLAEAEDNVKFRIVKSTAVIQIAIRHRIVFAIDISPSMGALDVGEGHVIFERVITAIRLVFTALSQKITLHNTATDEAGILLEPQVYVTVIAESSYVGSLQVMLQGLRLTEENLEATIGDLQDKWTAMESLAAAYRLEVLRGYKSRMSPDLSSLIQHACFALQLLPSNAQSSIVLLTDGVNSYQDTAEHNGLLMRLSREMVSVSTIQLADSSPYQAFGYVACPEGLEMISTKTNGVSFDTKALLGAATGWCCSGGIRRSLLQDLLLFKGFSLGDSHAPICQVHQSLLASSAIPAREDIVLPQDIPRWTLESEQEFDGGHFPWDPQGVPHPVAVVSAPALSYQVTVNLHSLLIIRSREGFFPTAATAPGLSSAFENTDATVELEFQWRSDIRLSYKITSLAPDAAGAVGSLVDIFLIADYEFMRRWRQFHTLLRNEPEVASRSMGAFRIAFALHRFIADIRAMDENLSQFVTSWSTEQAKGTPVGECLAEGLRHFAGGALYQWMSVETLPILLVNELQCDTTEASSNAIASTIAAEVASDATGRGRRASVLKKQLCERVLADSMWRASTGALRSAVTSWADAQAEGSQNTYVRVLDRTTECRPGSIPEFVILHVEYMRKGFAQLSFFFLSSPPSLRKEVVEHFKTRILSLGVLPAVRLASFSYELLTRSEDGQDPSHEQHLSLFLASNKPIGRLVASHSDITQKNPPEVAESLLSLLHTYMLRDTRSWSVQSNLSRRRVLNMLIQARLQEGFVLLESSGSAQGEITLTFAAELPVIQTDEHARASLHFQYILRAHGVTILTEFWMDPQAGSVVRSSNAKALSRSKFSSGGDKSYIAEPRTLHSPQQVFREIMNSLFKVDTYIVTALCTFDRLTQVPSRQDRPEELTRATNQTVSRLSSILFCAPSSVQYLKIFQSTDDGIRNHAANEILAATVESELLSLSDCEVDTNAKDWCTLRIAGLGQGCRCFVKLTSTGFILSLVAWRALEEDCSDEDEDEGSVTSLSGSGERPLKRNPATPKERRPLSKADSPLIRSRSTSVKTKKPDDKISFGEGFVPGRLAVVFYECNEQQLLSAPLAFTSVIFELARRAEGKEFNPILLPWCRRQMDIQKAMPFSAATKQYQGNVRRVYEQAFSRGVYTNLRDGVSVTPGDVKTAVDYCTETEIPVDITQYLRILQKADVGHQQAAQQFIEHQASVLFAKFISRAEGTEYFFYSGAAVPGAKEGKEETEFDDDDEDYFNEAGPWESSDEEEEEQELNGSNGVSRQVLDDAYHVLHSKGNMGLYGLPIFLRLEARFDLQLSDGDEGPGDTKTVSSGVTTVPSLGTVSELLGMDTTLIEFKRMTLCLVALSLRNSNSVAMDDALNSLKDELRSLFSTGILVALMGVKPLTQPLLTVVRYNLKRVVHHSSLKSAVYLDLPLVDKEAGQEILGEELERAFEGRTRKLGDTLFAVEFQAGERQEGEDAHFYIRYWLLISHSGTTVALHFFSHDMAAVDRSQCLSAVRATIRRLCDRLNQVILLRQLHENRECSDLLVPPDTPKKATATVNNTLPRPSDPSRPVTDPPIAEGAPSRLLLSSAGSQLYRYHPGQFECQKVHSIVLPLNERVDPSLAYATLTNTSLDPFTVSNRAGLFVYQDSKRNVFYMRLVMETRAAEGGRETTAKNANGDPVTAARIAGEQDKVSGERHCLILNVFGIDPPGQEIQELQKLLESKLNNLTAQTISQNISRNPRLKMTRSDIAFLKSAQQYEFKIPVPAIVYRSSYEFLAHLRQNAMQYLLPLRLETYQKEKALGLDSMPPDTVQVAKRELKYLYSYKQSPNRNQPIHHSIGQGLVLLHFFVSDAQGERRTLIPYKRSVGEPSHTAHSTKEETLAEGEASQRKADAEAEAAANYRSLIAMNPQSIESWEAIFQRVAAGGFRDEAEGVAFFFGIRMWPHGSSLRVEELEKVLILTMRKALVEHALERTYFVDEADKSLASPRTLADTSAIEMKQRAAQWQRGLSLAVKFDVPSVVSNSTKSGLNIPSWALTDIVHELAEHLVTQNQRFTPVALVEKGESVEWYEWERGKRRQGEHLLIKVEEKELYRFTLFYGSLVPGASKDLVEEHQLFYTPLVDQRYSEVFKRHWFCKVTITCTNVELLTYNWTTGSAAALLAWTTRLLQWKYLRSHFLSTILHQKTGFLRHISSTVTPPALFNASSSGGGGAGGPGSAPMGAGGAPFVEVPGGSGARPGSRRAHLSGKPSTDVKLDLTRAAQVMGSKTPVPLVSKPARVSGNAEESALQQLRPQLESVYRDQPAESKISVKMHSRDEAHAQQFFKEADKVAQASLHRHLLARAFAGCHQDKVGARELSLLLSRSKFLHACRQPFAVHAFKGYVEHYDAALRGQFMEAYQSYLASLHVHPVSVITYPRREDEGTAYLSGKDHYRLFRSKLEAGLVLIEIYFSSMYVCTNLYAHAGAPAKAASSLPWSSKVFYREALAFKELLHMNSFVYDFQLQFVQKNIFRGYTAATESLAGAHGRRLRYQDSLPGLASLQMPKLQLLPESVVDMDTLSTAPRLDESMLLDTIQALLLRHPTVSSFASNAVTSAAITSELCIPQLSKFLLFFGEHTSQYGFLALSRPGEGDTRFVLCTDPTCKMLEQQQASEEQKAAEHSFGSSLPHSLKSSSIGRRMSAARLLPGDQPVVPPKITSHIHTGVCRLVDRKQLYSKEHRKRYGVTKGHMFSVVITSIAIVAPTSNLTAEVAQSKAQQISSGASSKQRMDERVQQLEISFVVIKAHSSRLLRSSVTLADAADEDGILAGAQPLGPEHSTLGAWALYQTEVDHMAQQAGELIRSTFLEAKAHFFGEQVWMKILRQPHAGVTTAEKRALLGSLVAVPLQELDPSLDKITQKNFPVDLLLEHLRTMAAQSQALAAKASGQDSKDSFKSLDEITKPVDLVCMELKQLASEADNIEEYIQFNPLAMTKLLFHYVVNREANTLQVFACTRLPLEKREEAREELVEAQAQQCTTLVNAMCYVLWRDLLH